VLQATMDFGCNDIARLAMRCKRLQQRAFSLLSARRSAQLAFSPPQRV
jgi:hypothetical protein